MLLTLKQEVIFGIYKKGVIFFVITTILHFVLCILNLFLRGLEYYQSQTVTVAKTEELQIRKQEAEARILEAEARIIETPFRWFIIAPFLGIVPFYGSLIILSGRWINWTV